MSARPSPSESSPGSEVPTARLSARLETVLLIAVAVLLVLSLALPWWTESEVSPGAGSVTSTQNYSPITGVTGTCSPACSPIFNTPPFGPFQGTHTFSSVGLNQTAYLYDVTLAFVTVGIASCIVAIIAGRSRAPPDSLRRQNRVYLVLLNLALVMAALGTSVLAWVQPVTLRADTMAAFNPHDAWTAAPSPETSFWGSCSPGPSNGLCASGWSASWGPGVGWDLIAVAAVLLVVLHLLLFLRSRPTTATSATSG